MEVLFFSVGHGNFSTVVGSSSVTIIDCGGSTLNDYNNFKYIFEKCYKKNVNIVITHANKDHYNFLESLLTGFSLRKILVKTVKGGAKDDYSQTIPNSLLHEEQNNQIVRIIGESDMESVLPTTQRYKNNVNRYNRRSVSFEEKVQCIHTEDNDIVECTQLDAFLFKDSVYKIEFLNLIKKIEVNNPEDLNSISLIIKVTDTYSKVSYVFTGDANGETINRMYKKHGLQGTFTILECDVFLLAHHGTSSNGCNDHLLFTLTNPQVVIISCGYNNPSSQTIDVLLNWNVTSNSLMSTFPHKLHVVGKYKCDLFNKKINIDYCLCELSCNKAIYSTFSLEISDS